MFEINKFDFFVRFVYNSTANNNDRLSCSLGYSDVLFEERTVEQITRRFQHLFHKYFHHSQMLYLWTNLFHRLIIFLLFYRKKLKN